jgi:hypothetical protein
VEIPVLRGQNVQVFLEEFFIKGNIKLTFFQLQRIKVLSSILHTWELNLVDAEAKTQVPDEKPSPAVFLQQRYRYVARFVHIDDHLWVDPVSF